MKLGELAARIGCTLEGPEDLEILGVAGLEEATPSDLAFLANPKYQAKSQRTRAAAVIAAPEANLPGLVLLRARDPYLAFARALEIFHPATRPEPGVHSTAIVAPTAKVGRRTSIGPYAVIEDGVTLGEDCVLKSFVMIYAGATIGDRFFAHSHAVVRENVRIGNDVVLQNGAVAGADGFGFVRREDGSYYKIIQPGGVVIEDGVEIQANSCIDRASVGVTRIRKGAKIDNLVQVGHGCDVGENTLLCAQVGLAGSSKVGKNVVLTGQVGVAGHLTIGDEVIATPQSGIPNDVPPRSIVSGSPSIEHGQWLRAAAVFSRLPEMYSSLRKIRATLAKVGLSVDAPPPSADAAGLEKRIETAKDKDHREGNKHVEET